MSNVKMYISVPDSHPEVQKAETPEDIDLLKTEKLLVFRQSDDLREIAKALYADFSMEIKFTNLPPKITIHGISQKDVTDAIIKKVEALGLTCELEKDVDWMDFTG